MSPAESPELSRVRVGQTWRRKSDGTLTRIVFVDRIGKYHKQISHDCERRTHNKITTFLEQYELVDNPPVPEL
jgi:hypothetical protein